MTLPPSDPGEIAFWRRHPPFRKAGGIVGPNRELPGEPYLWDGLSEIYQRAARFLATQPYAAFAAATPLLLLGNPEMNAIAAHRGDRRAIGIHLGTGETLWRAFEAGLSRALFAGHPAGGDASPCRMIPQLPEISGSEADGPSRTDRALVQDLYTRAIEFLIYHEFAHHARGHIELAEKRLGLDAVDEGVNMAALSERGNQLLRFIEFDADHHALDMLWQAREAAQPPAGLDAETLAAGLVLDVTAITVLFMRLDAAHSALEAHYASSHPPPVHRAMRASHTLATTYESELGWDWDDIRVLHDEGWSEAGRVAEVLGMPAGRWRGETTEGMGADWLAEEEEEFFAFSRALDEENTGDT